MFENIIKVFRNISKKEGKKQTQENSKDAAKERLHLVLMQDRANVSADFLELMKQEIIDVIKKYIEIDEKEIDVRLTNKENEDGTHGAPALYANIPILNIKNETRKVNKKEEKQENRVEDIKEENINKKEDIVNKESECIEKKGKDKDSQNIENEDDDKEAKENEQKDNDKQIENPKGENKEEVDRKNEEEITDNEQNENDANEK